MRNSDLLARIGGVLMAVASFWNVMAAVGWVLAFWWLLFGLLWLVPLGLALLELLFAVVLVVFGHKGFGRMAWMGPLVGLFVSLCNLNFLAMMLELVNLVVMSAAAVARSAEDRGY